MNKHVNLQGFSSPEYYLNKLLREINRLREAQNCDCTEDAKDHGLNAAITAWHIPEWITSSQNLNRNVNEYRNDLIKQKSDYALMHDIATQAKHFKVSAPQHKTQFEVRIDASLALTPGEQSMLSQSFQNDPEQSVYFRPQNSFQSILKIDDRDALPFFEEIYDFLKTEMIRPS